MGTYHVTNLYTCFITVLSLEHNTKSKMNFIGTAKTRIQVQNLLEDFDSPKNGKKIREGRQLCCRQLHCQDNYSIEYPPTKGNLHVRPLGYGELLTKKVFERYLLYMLLSRKKVFGQKTTAELIVVIETCLKQLFSEKKKYKCGNKD